MNAYLVLRNVYDSEGSDEMTVFVSLSYEKAREERMRLFILNYVYEIEQSRKGHAKWNGSTVFGDDIRKTISYDEELDTLQLSSYYDESRQLYIEPLVIDRRYAIR